MSSIFSSPFMAKSPLNQVDPDAPGTKGKPGYEPKVKRRELDKKGKKKSPSGKKNPDGSPKMVNNCVKKGSKKK